MNTFFTKQRIRLLLTTCQTVQEIEELFNLCNIITLEDKISLLTEPGVKYFDLSEDLETKYYQLLAMYPTNYRLRQHNCVEKYTNIDE